MTNNARNCGKLEGIMGRTLRQARDRAAGAPGRQTMTHIEETDNRDGATENRSANDERGEEVESRSREDEMDNGRQGTGTQQDTYNGVTEVEEGGNRVSAMAEDGNRDARSRITPGGSYGTPTNEDSFHTARDTVATRPTATDRSKAISEEPSVASPLKPTRQRTGGQGRGEQTTDETGRAATRRIEEAQQPTFPDANR